MRWGQVLESGGDLLGELSIRLQENIVLPLPHRRSLTTVCVGGTQPQDGMLPFIGLYGYPYQEQLIPDHKKHRIAIRQVGRIRQFKRTTPLPTPIIQSRTHNPYVICATLTATLEPCQQQIAAGQLYHTASMYVLRLQRKYQAGIDHLYARRHLPIG